MPWRALHDPHNPESRIAGGPSDLIKHAVSLAALEVWCRDGEGTVHECHAGRGVYALAADSPKRDALRAARDRGGALWTAHDDALDALGTTLAEGWWAGSTLLHGRGLTSTAYEHVAYEWDPDTRRILAATLDAAGVRTRVVGRDSPDTLDGESQITALAPSWHPNDVLLLDPFGLWHGNRHAFRRARYRRLVEALAACAHPPRMCIFFTWGTSAARATRDRGALARREHGDVGDGYASLGMALLEAGRALTVVDWDADLHCSMWLLGEGLAVGALEASLAPHGHAVTVARLGSGGDDDA